MTASPSMNIASEDTINLLLSCLFGCIVKLGNFPIHDSKQKHDLRFDMASTIIYIKAATAQSTPRARQTLTMWYKSGTQLTDVHGIYKSRCRTTLQTSITYYKIE